MSASARNAAISLAAITLVFSWCGAAVATTVAWSSPGVDTQFASSANFDCNGTITDPGSTSYIYLQSFDIGGVTVVSAVNATWDASLGNAPWKPGTLTAPVGGIPDVISPFNAQADADDAMGTPQSTATRALKVKGPHM
jgi:hypothetical protein